MTRYNVKISLNHEEGYSDRNGTTVYREWGVSPNGNPFDGAWVLRVNGTYVDHDRYRTDLSERNGLVLQDKSF